MNLHALFCFNHKVKQLFRVMKLSKAFTVTRHHWTAAFGGWVFVFGLQSPVTRRRPSRAPALVLTGHPGLDKPPVSGAHVDPENGLLKD